MVWGGFDVVCLFFLHCLFGIFWRYLFGSFGVGCLEGFVFVVVVFLFFDVVCLRLFTLFVWGVLAFFVCFFVFSVCFFFDVVCLGGLRLSLEFFWRCLFAFFVLVVWGAAICCCCLLILLLQFVAYHSAAAAICCCNLLL